MIIIWLGPLLFLLTPDPYQACPASNIFIKNGTWCCGLIETREYDSSWEIVTEITEPTESVTEKRKSKIKPPKKRKSAPQKKKSPPKKPQMPGPAGGIAAQCACGRTSMSETEAEGGRVQGHRPWLGRMSILMKDSTKVYCSAILITRSWFLSAAHCFCIAIDCIQKAGDVRIPVHITATRNGNDNNQLSKFNVRFGLKKNDSFIVELRIHSQYTGEPGEGPNVGLAKTSTEVYVHADGYAMVPICLSFGTGTDKEENNPYINDMDCEFIKGGENLTFPEPAASSTATLSCNPGQFMEGSEVNFIEKRSHMTAYGGGDDTNRCTTNSYGPVGGTLSYCKGKCSYEPNPTDALQICNKAVNEGLFLQDVNPEFNLDVHGKYLNEEYHDIAWVKIINNDGDEEVTCYPDDATVQSLDDFPFRYGWCNVNTVNGWGWCSTSCNAANWSIDVHEQIVNTYVYDDCAHGVVAGGLESCVSAPIVSAYGKVYEMDEDGELHLLDNVLRQSQQEIKVKEKKEIKEEKAKGFIEPCYGDVGGAVWKYMVQKVAHGSRERLATLTGIISRFDEECGAFREHPDKVGRQNIVMTRIRKIMPWIMQYIYELRQCYGETY